MVWPFPVLLAHGALGPLDEILLIVVAGLFVVMFAAPTVIAFLRRGRDEGGEHAEDADSASPAETPSVEPEPSRAVRRDHFRLD